MENKCQHFPGKQCRDCLYAAENLYDPCCLFGHIRHALLSGTREVVWIDIHRYEKAMTAAKEAVALSILGTMEAAKL